jgi:hypothetical protein
MLPARRTTQPFRRARPTLARLQGVPESAPVEPAARVMAATAFARAIAPLAFVAWLAHADAILPRASGVAPGTSAVKDWTTRHAARMAERVLRAPPSSGARSGRAPA